MVLARWVEFFDDLKNVRGRSQNTIMAYRRDLELYTEFTESSKDISKLYDFMVKRGLSQRSQARMVSALRTYFRFCEARGDKPTELIELHIPEVKVPPPKPLGWKEFQSLYKACEVEDDHRKARNQITLLLLYGLGCRVSELISLDLQDFNPSEGWLNVTGKAKRQRQIPLSKVILKELNNYLLNVRTHLLRKQSEGSILINDRGHRPSRVDIWRWLSAWSHTAGFAKTVHPHQFRHGCATSLLNGGTDLASIQKILGHSSIQSTQLYTRIGSKPPLDSTDTISLWNNK